MIYIYWTDGILIVAMMDFSLSYWLMRVAAMYSAHYGPDVPSSFSILKDYLTELPVVVLFVVYVIIFDYVIFK